MAFHRSLAFAALAGLLLAVGASGAPRRVPTARRKSATAAKRKPVAPKMTVASRLGPLTPEEARQTVALLHDAYQTVLEETHAVYHAKPGQPVAAKIVRELQEKMGSLGWPQSHFLGVNALIMRPDHRANDAFERDAVRQLSDGKPQVEAMDGKVMRFATGVPLAGECGSCHWMDQGGPRRAAITWRIPLKAGSVLSGPETAAEPADPIRVLNQGRPVPQVPR